jgi:hypothetical protein
MIAAVDAAPHKSTRFEATTVWMHSTPLHPGATYLLKHTTQTVRARVVEIKSRIDVEHLEEQAAEQLSLNDIGHVVIETSRPLLADLYRDNRTTGSLILIDPADNATAGAGMIRDIHDTDHRHAVTGLLAVGNRPQLAARLEQSLLAAGALVLRTRVPASASLSTFARLGAFLLVESDDPGPITFALADGLATKPYALAPELETSDQILSEIERLSATGTGDENDNGLGI